MNIIVASTNPVKIKAVKEAFSLLFPNMNFTVEGINAPSNTASQPRSGGETLKGAYNRVLFARKNKPHADYWVGIEGGIEDTIDGMQAFAVVEILSKNNKRGTGKTGTFILPEKVADLIRYGKELGEADDIVFNLKESKKKQGAVGILTNTIITRTAYYRDAVILALIPFINPTLYPDPEQ